MKITLEINDEVLPSVEKWMRMQFRTFTNPVTKSQDHEPMYASVEELCQKTTGQMIDQIVRQYPTPAIQERLAAAQAIHDEVKALAMPGMVGA